jgi:hypothetical protein
MQRLSVHPPPRPQVSRAAGVEAGEFGATLVVCASDDAALDAVLAALPPPPPLDEYSRAHSSSERLSITLSKPSEICTTRVGCEVWKLDGHLACL